MNTPTNNNLLFHIQDFATQGHFRFPLGTHQPNTRIILNPNSTIIRASFLSLKKFMVKHFKTLNSFFIRFYMNLENLNNAEMAEREQ